jgi:hypothetical protein
VAKTTNQICRPLWGEKDLHFSSGIEMEEAVNIKVPTTIPTRTSRVVEGGIILLILMSVVYLLLPFFIRCLRTYTTYLSSTHFISHFNVSSNVTQAHTVTLYIQKIVYNSKSTTTKFFFF